MRLFILFFLIILFKYSNSHEYKMLFEQNPDIITATISDVYGLTNTGEKSFNDFKQEFENDFESKFGLKFKNEYENKSKEELKKKIEDESEDNYITKYKKKERIKRSINHKFFNLPYYSPAYKSQFSPPYVPLNKTTFMRSPKSFENKNREKFLISEIKQLNFSVLISSNPLSWNHISFKSSNYIMLHQFYNVHVFKLDSPPSNKGLALFEQLVCKIATQNFEKISKPIFFKQKINHQEHLRIAFIATSKVGDNKLYIYEIAEKGKCKFLYFIKLGLMQPIKLDYILTNDYVGFVILIKDDFYKKPYIEHVKKIHDNSVKLLKVHFNKPIDIQTFQMNGLHYLALAHNFEINIYKFDEYLLTNKLHQTLYFMNVLSLKAFKMNFKLYLVVSTRSKFQHILLWKDGEFVYHQTILDEQSIEWQIINLETCKNNMFLALSRNNLNNPLTIYNYNEERNKFQPIVHRITDFTEHKFLIKPNTMISFNYNSTAYIIELDQAGLPRLLAIKSNVQQVDDPIFHKIDYIEKYTNGLHLSLMKQQNLLAKSIHTLSNGVTYASNIVVDSQQKLTNVDSLNPSTIDEIKQVIRTIWQGTSLTSKDKELDLGNMGYKLNILKQKYLHLKNDLLNNAVLKDKVNFVKGNTVFLNGISSLNKLMGKKVHVNKALNNSVTLLLKDLVLNNEKNVTVMGKKMFLQEINVRGNLNTNRVNKVDNFINKVALKNRRLLFRSVLNFTNGFKCKNLTSNGFMNGLNLNNDPYYFDEGKVRIISNVQLMNVSVLNLNTKYINRVDMNDLYLNTLKKNGFQTINSPIHIKELITINNFDLKSRKINNFDLNYLNDNFIKKNLPFEILDSVTILNNFDIQNNLNVNRLNSLRIPIDFVSKTNDQIIYGKKKISGEIICLHDLIVNKLVNGISYPRDVVTLTLNEKISSPLVFNMGFSVLGNVELEGKLNQINLKKLFTYSKNGLKKIDGNINFNGKIRVKNLITDGLINNLNLTRFSQRLIFKNETVLKIFGPKLFTKGLTFNYGLVKKINDLSTEQLVTTKNQIVFAKLKSASPFNFENLNIYNNLINGLDIVNYAKNHISLKRSEYIVTNKKFEFLETRFSLIVKGKINHLKPEVDFVLNDNVGQINSRIRFVKQTNINSKISCNKITVKNSFSNINLTDITKRRIRLDTDDGLNYNIKLASVMAEYINLTDKKLINNINFNHLLTNLFYKNGDQIITSNIVFERLLHFKKPVYSKLINNISIPYLRDFALRKTGNQIIDNNVIFSNDVEIESLDVANNFNNVNLNKLISDAVRYDENAFIKSKTVFLSQNIFLNNIYTNRINGLDLIKDVFLRKFDQVINANLFIKQLITDKSIILKSGYINGKNFIQFEKNVLRKDRPNIIKGNLNIQKSAIVLSGTRVQGLINGVNLTDIVSNNFFRRGDQRINFLKIKNVPVTFKNIYVSNVNGYNLNEFMNNLIFINTGKPQFINSDKLFNKVILRGNHFFHHINSTSIINGYDINKLFYTRIPISSLRPIKIDNDIVFNEDVYFKSNFLVKNKINNFDLLRESIFLNDFTNQIQTLNGKKYFSKAYFEDDVNIKNYLNGRLVKDLSESTLSLNENQFISDTKHIQGKVIINNGLEVNYFNNKIVNKFPFLNYDSLDESILDTTQDVEILGNLNVKGLINNIDMNSLFKNSLQSRSPQVINGNLAVDELVITKDVKFSGPLNNININYFLDEVSNFSYKGYSQLMDLNKQLVRQTSLSNDIISYLRQSTVGINSVVYYQTLANVFGSFINNYPIQIAETISRSKIMSTIFYNNRINSFVVTQSKSLKDFTYHIDLIKEAKLYIELPTLAINQRARVFKSGIQIGLLNNYINQVEFIILKDNQILIVSLESIKGKLSAYILNPINNNFKFITDNDIGADAKKIALFQADDEIYIAVSISSKEVCSLNNQGSLIFKFVNKNKFELIQRINLPDVNNVVYYNFNDQHYLIFSSQETINGPSDENMLNVYRKTNDKINCQFTLFQKLAFSNTVDLITFKFGSKDKLELYLLSLNSNKLILWKHNGFSGFIPISVVDVIDATKVLPVLAENRLYFIVSQTRNCRGSFIFKAILKVSGEQLVKKFDNCFDEELNTIKKIYNEFTTCFTKTDHLLENHIYKNLSNQINEQFSSLADLQQQLISTKQKWSMNFNDCRNYLSYKKLGNYFINLNKILNKYKQILEHVACKGEFGIKSTNLRLRLNQAILQLNKNSVFISEQPYTKKINCFTIDQDPIFFIKKEEICFYLVNYSNFSLDITNVRLIKEPILENNLFKLDEFLNSKNNFASNLNNINVASSKIEWLASNINQAKKKFQIKINYLSHENENFIFFPNRYRFIITGKFRNDLESQFYTDKFYLLPTTEKNSSFSLNNNLSIDNFYLNANDNFNLLQPTCSKNSYLYEENFEVSNLNEDQIKLKLFYHIDNIMNNLNHQNNFLYKLNEIEKNDIFETFICQDNLNSNIDLLMGKELANLNFNLHIYFKQASYCYFDLIEIEIRNLVYGFLHRNTVINLLKNAKPNSFLITFCNCVLNTLILSYFDDNNQFIELYFFKHNLRKKELKDYLETYKDFFKHPIIKNL